MKELYRVTRIGNEFIVAKSKCGHHYIALVLGNARITAWHRTTLEHINEHYRKVER